MTALRRGRVRDALATISSTPWRRAPWLLRRRPGVLAAVAGACAVMVAAVAAVPLFLSSVGSASLALQAAERCPRDTGASVPLVLDADGVEAPPDDPFGAVSDRLGPSNRWLSVQRVPLVGPVDDTTASLIARDDALDHVEVLEGATGPGIWISDRGAELTGLSVGDMAMVGQTELPVAGTYRDLSGTSVDDFWCSNANLVLLEQRGGDLVAPPPLVLLDPASLALVMRDATIAAAQGAWEAPLRPGITVAEAASLVPTLGCGTAEGEALRWCDGPLVAAGPGWGTPLVEPTDIVERYLRSHLPFVLARSAAIRTTVGGGIWPMAGFAALAGAGLVAAAASLWFDRRRREVTLLTVRGVTPAALGLKAVLELASSLLVGGVVGVALAYAMVVWLGPSPEVEPGAIADAALVGLAATAGAAATIQVVVARRARAHGNRATRRPWLTLLPWELALAWATVVSYRRLGEWGIPVGRGADVTRVDLWGLLFPVLFLVTVVAVLSRVLSLAIRPLRTISARWPIALYLGVRRVARYRVAVLGLVAASAIATGVLGYASTMNRSLDATLEAKVLTYVGSDTAARMGNDQQLPEELVDRSTVVHRLQPAWIVDDGDRDKVLVMGVDTDTFARAALWYPEYGDASLRDVLDQLAAPPVDGHLQAVLVGADVEGTTEVGLFRYGDARFTVDILPSVRSFPGMSKPRPTLIVATDALDDEEVRAAAREVWIRGDHDETTATLRAAGIRFEEVRRAAEVADGATFLTVSWTFGFMLSLGVAAGLLVLGGVAVYLDARRRDRILAHAFMRRMGLRRRQHRGALMVELTASVPVGCWIGLAVALVTARLAHRRLDPIPSYDPVPLLRPAGLLLAALALGAVALTLVAAFVAQRRVDRDDPVEVLRAGV